MRRHVLGGVGRAVGGALRELVRGRTACCRRPARTSRRGSASSMCCGVGEAAARRRPPAGRKRGTPHQARRPDVAIDAALVAQPVGEARLAEQLVELALVRRRHLGADVGDAGLDVRWPALVAGHGACGCARSSASGSSSAVGSAMSKPSIEAVADQIEIGGDRGAGLAVQRAQALEQPAPGRRRTRAARVPRRRWRRPASGAPSRRSRRPTLPPCRASGPAARTCGSPVQSPAWARKSPVGQHRAGGEAHVLRDHRRMVVAAALQVGDQLGIRRARRDRCACSSRCVAIERRLVLLVPFAAAARARAFCAKTSSARLKRSGSRPRAPAAPGCSRSPDIGDLQAVDQHAVEAGEIVGALFERRADASPGSSASTGRGKCTGSCSQVPGPGGSK